MHTVNFFCDLPNLRNFALFVLQVRAFLSHQCRFLCFFFYFRVRVHIFLSLTFFLLHARGVFAVTNLLLAFSLPRNWYKLTTETQSTELSRDLRSINCFRTICMFGVICAHCALANNMVPQLNPYYIEEVCKKRGESDCLINDELIIQHAKWFCIVEILCSDAYDYN